MKTITYNLIFLGCFIYTKAQVQPILHLASFNNRMIPHLLQALTQDHDNVVYSPFGLTTSLAVVFEGVDDKIAIELCKILGLGSPKTTRENLRLGIKTLLEYMQVQLKKNTDGTTGSFNKAHVNSPEPLIPQYAQLLKTYYKTEISNNITANASELIFELMTDTRAMGHWKDYDKLAVYTYLSHQASVPFMTPEGDVVDVPMIPQVGLFKAGYHPKLSSQIVELPLEHESTSLVLIMPDYKDGMSDVLVKMLEVDLTTMMKKLPSSEVEVTLPQFALVSSELDVGKILKRSGLGVAFVKTNKSKRRASLGGEGPLKTIKQNSYFATSFTSINSIGSTTSILYRKVKKPKRPKGSQTPNVKETSEQTADGEIQEKNEEVVEPESSEQTANGEIQEKNEEVVEQKQVNIEEPQDRHEDNESNVTQETLETTEAQESQDSQRQKRATAQNYSFNKPFIFFVYHTKSGIILLAGAVKRPTQVPNP